VADGRRFNLENVAATLARCRSRAPSPDDDAVVVSKVAIAQRFPVRRERQMPGGSVITVCGKVIVGGSFGMGGK
jgi:hypothetical protein